MSTLKVANISNLAGTVSVTSDNLVSGTAKAWVNFNGTGTPTIPIRASFNVTSITDNAVGQWTVNFTNAMADVNYVVAGSASSINAATDSNAIRPAVRATTSIGVYSVTSNGLSYADVDAMQVVIFR